MNEADAYLELQDEVKEYKQVLTVVKKIVDSLGSNPYNVKEAELAIGKIKVLLRYLSL